MGRPILDSELSSVGVIVPYFRNPVAWSKARRALEEQGIDSSRIFVRDNSIDNVFYTAAVNEGINRFALMGESNFVLALTQDAVLFPRALASMLEVMRANPKVGIVAPVSIDSGGKVKWCGGSDALPWGRHFTTPRDSLPKAPYGTLWANGACMLLRSEMIREIGVMDESLKFIFSDIDYSFRARERGWGVVVCPFAFIEHELAGSSAAAPDWLQIVKLEDQIRFAEKWGFSSAYQRLAREAARMPAERIRELCAAALTQIETLRRSTTP